MKSLTGKFSSVRGWALLLLLLLGAGLFVAACADEDVPAPTTPAPPPPAPPPPAPEPEPEPEAPAVPVGLRISASGPDFIEWSWTPVADVSGYDVQFSANQAFTDEDEIIARTAEEISYRRDGLAEGTDAYLRVRSASGTSEERITSDWSTHVTGMTLAPVPEPVPEPPAVPVGLRISDRGEDFIEWSWDPVDGVNGYDVQFSTNEIFSDEDEVIARTVEEVSYRREDLEAETSAYLRVRSAAGAGEDRINSDWSIHLTGMTLAPEPEPVPPAVPTGLVVSDTTETSITWTWNAVDGAVGYVVQANMDEMFDATDTVMFNGVPFTTETSYTATDLEPETTLYVRVAAGAGTPTAPLVSAFTGHVTGMTAAAAPQAPAAPANLREKDTGSDYIEWEWDEVEGASGYHAQFSTDSGFSVSDDFFLQGMSNTDQRVSKLEPESAGYFRVRAYVGTTTDRVFGEWSKADKAATDEPPPPPPAEPLDAPDNVETSDRQDNSIAVAWDAVDDADEYEVQQREDGGDWVDANCGSATGSNVVTDTSCVASGLDEDTEYDFRVKAFPDSSDSTKTESGWSGTASATTTGEAPAPPITGGANDINLQWSSDGNGISWDWDPVADRAQRGRIQNYVALLTATTHRCPALTLAAAASLTATVPQGEEFRGSWFNGESDISANSPVTVPGEIQGLCVVRSWDDSRDVRQFGDASLAWGSTAPAFPTPTGGDPNPSMRHPSDSADRGSTESITWRFATDKDFDYELRVLSANREGTHPSSCNAGDPASAPAASTTDNVVVPHVIRNPVAYSSYELCIRAVDPNNDDSHSAWQKVGGIALTRPSAPAPPKLQSTDSEITNELYGGQNPKRLVWTVDENKGTPRDEMEFDVTVFESTDNITADDALQMRCLAVASGDAAIGDAEHVASMLNASMGIEVRVAAAAGLIADTDPPDVYYFYACVRADPDNNNPDLTADNEVDASDQGLWSVNKVSYAGGQPDVGDLSNVVQDDERPNTATRVYFEWTAVDGASYEVQFAQLETGDVGDDSPGVQTKSASTTARYTVTAKAGMRYSLRVRYSLKVGGRTLRSGWSTAGDLRAVAAN